MAKNIRRFVAMSIVLLALVALPSLAPSRSEAQVIKPLPISCAIVLCPQGTVCCENPTRCVEGFKCP
jgi:hypothetical protein